MRMTISPLNQERPTWGVKWMTRMILFSILVFFPIPAFSDCVNLGRSSGFYAEGGHSLIFYSGMVPLARLDVPYCTITPSSTARVIKSYVCDGDKIMIDGEECMIMTVTSPSTKSF